MTTTRNRWLACRNAKKLVKPRAVISHDVGSAWQRCRHALCWRCGHRRGRRKRAGRHPRAV